MPRVKGTIPFFPPCSSTPPLGTISCSGSLSIRDSNPRTPHASASQGFLVTLLDHRRRRGRVDLRGFELRMPEKLLDLFEGHPAFEQRGRDGVTEQVRIDARGDARERRRFLHN